MRLQQSFFWWIAVSAILPLTILILGVTLYGERLYRQQIGQQIYASLNNISADIERSLAYERSIMLQAASSLAMRRYLPVLLSVKNGELPADFNVRTDYLNRFLLSFNNIMQGQGVLRVLDYQGNTLLKVGLGRITPPSFDGFEGIPYAEEKRASISGDNASIVADLNENEVNFITLIAPDIEPPLLDGVIPLNYENQRVGYLVTSLTGHQMDHILQLATRPYEGRISLIEMNMDSPDRHGRVLYDDQSLLFSAPAVEAEFARESLLNAAQEQPEGSLVEQQQTIYFTETFPYPDQLLSWVIGIRVDEKKVSTPFQRLRVGILVFAVLTLLLSLIVAHFGARQIVQPISQLIRNFRAMSSGKQTAALTAQGAEEIVELSTAFNEMQDDLSVAQAERDRAQDMAVQNARLASIGQLAAGIGHELNNPLNNVLSYAKLIEKDVIAGKAVATSDIYSIKQECDRASVIIRGILNFSRQVPVHFTEFMLQDWLEQSLALVQAEADKKAVSLTLQLSKDYPLRADRVQLQQALINLLVNAIQASNEGSTITVSAESMGQHHRISVLNPGKGIAADVMDRLFEPFFTTKDIGEGSGLGLSITLGIVEQHQGALQIENVVNDKDEIIGVKASMALPIKPQDNLELAE